MRKFQVGDHVRVKKVEVGSSVGGVVFVNGMKKTIDVVGVVKEYDTEDGSYLVCFESLESAGEEDSWWYFEGWLCYEEAVEDICSEVAKGGIQQNIREEGAVATCVSSSKRSRICGETYFYISSYFVPTSCIESRSDVDTMRYTAGNYFWSFEACVSACCKIRELLSKEVSLSEQK